MYFVMSNLTHPTCPEQFLYIFMIKYLSKKPESQKQKQIVIKTSIIISFLFPGPCYIVKNQALSIADTTWTSKPSLNRPMLQKMKNKNTTLSEHFKNQMTKT